MLLVQEVGRSMAAERYTEGLDFILDLTSGVPYYRQVIKQVEMAIAEGRLRKGSKLPKWARASAKARNPPTRIHGF